MGATLDQHNTPPRAKLDASLVTLWLVIGTALVVTAVLAIGWRRAVLIWLASAVLLGIVLLIDVFPRRSRSSQGE